MVKRRRLPNHIAIIMDGNGRWARRKGFIRVRGHEEGVKSVREITTECAKMHIGQLTLYAFSNENWKRSKTEVKFL
ncbi:MAG: undecaprenyl diphosphate synthase family protein, partial [Planctomycetota bacterium]